MRPQPQTHRRPGAARRTPHVTVRGAASLLVAAALAAGAWLPAAAQVQALAASTGAPTRTTSATEPPHTGPATWGISPAGVEGADGRASLEVVAAPGETVTEHVEVRNVGESALTLRVYAADASSSDDGTFDVLSDDETSVGVGRWTTLGPTDVTLGPRERRVVSATIAVPADASPGDHAGGVVAVLRSGTVGGDTSVAVDRRVGTRLHVRVDGPVEPHLAVDVRSVRYAPSASPSGGQVVADVVVRNDGNVRLAGESRVDVEGPFGLSGGSSPALPVPELLPGDEYLTTVTVPAVAPLGRLLVTAEATATSSGEQDLTGTVPPGTDAASLWAVPWIALALLVAALAAGAWWIRRRRRRSAPAHDDETTAAVPRSSP
ncbi:DUF916 domain-containing protein [Cellulosimicrobium cellulans]|uniref:WxL protein peptidoglycan domain-containing protein n=1 Tax=Cellulosimicrobium cellulans TaxID=1710 RepID=UPI001EDB65DA|nr:DUF916 domain-containing protein [Cellulosimicrobium cellulans]UKJ63322.1 DUF916 domain-containing protein [Cellulosimicrobium cellulans]